MGKTLGASLRLQKTLGLRTKWICWETGMILENHLFPRPNLSPVVGTFMTVWNTLGNNTKESRFFYSPPYFTVWTASSRVNARHLVRLSRRSWFLTLLASCSFDRSAMKLVWSHVEIVKTRLCTVVDLVKKRTKRSVKMFPKTRNNSKDLTWPSEMP